MEPGQYRRLKSNNRSLMRDPGPKQENNAVAPMAHGGGCDDSSTRGTGTCAETKHARAEWIPSARHTRAQPEHGLDGALSSSRYLKCELLLQERDQSEASFGKKLTYIYSILCYCAERGKVMPAPGDDVTDHAGFLLPRSESRETNCMLLSARRTSIIIKSRTVQAKRARPAWCSARNVILWTPWTDVDTTSI